MPSVEELLNQDSEEVETYADTGIEYCTVDDDTRLVTVPDRYKKLGVESDEKAKRIWFRFPKLVGNNGIDLSAIGVRVNYRNANGDGDIYIVEDLTTDGDYVTFSWELTRKVTAYKGNVSFVVCAVKSATDGTIKNEWNTTLNKECEVLEGLQVTEQITQENPDIIEYILANLGSGGTGLSTKAIDKLEEVGNYLVYTTADGGSKWTELISILRNGSSGGGSGETVTLQSISATYTGGEVTTGTALSDLTGIIVTATYSDGTTKTVTGYTLSGEILEGENIITVSYGGKTTTFTVTGIVESGGGEATAELPTDGLVSYFDFRTCEYNNEGSGNLTLIQPTQGNGQLFTWANNMVTEQNDYGMKASRSFMFDKNGGISQSDCGESFTWVFKCYLTELSSPMFTNDYGSLSNNYKIYYKPKYNTASSTAQVAGEGLGARLVDAYNLLILVVDKNICKLYFGNELIKEIDGNTIEGFVSWYSKLMFSIMGNNNAGYFSQLAIYNKALSDVEITEMKAYLETLEVA